MYTIVRDTYYEMEGGISLHEFVSMVTSRPHIAENIVSHLEAIDIVNCLRTCKDLRRLIFSAIGWSQKLKGDVDNAVSRLAVTFGSLASEQHGPLELEYKGGTSQSERFSFGLNGSLWLFRPVYEDPGGLLDYDYDKHHFSRMLSIYDLRSGVRTKTFPMKYSFGRPKVRILPCDKVLLQDREKTVMFSEGREEKSSSYGALWEKPRRGDEICEPFLGDDCIYESENQEDGRVISYYCDLDGIESPDGASKIVCHEGELPSLKKV